MSKLVKLEEGKKPAKTPIKPQTPSEPLPDAGPKPPTIPQKPPKK